MVKGVGRNWELERRWRELIEDQNGSGLTVVAFCKERGVPASSFHYWRRELKRRDAERTTDVIRPRKQRELSDFVPVHVMADARDGVEIDLAGAVVRVRRGFDEEALSRVIHVLRREDSANGEARSC